MYNFHKITFSHLVLIGITDINIEGNNNHHNIANVKNFKFQGMHSKHLIAVYLQNANAKFYDSGEVENVCITYTNGNYI